ncbi:MAG: hypothetical protein JXR91_14095 [Deltaproteobacteria bacterium]|nr:hypothetical protein [Deltaproteobacteria bacterium]
MNWLNSMIIDLQKKIWDENQHQIEAGSTFGISNSQETAKRLHQFKNRLQDLDKRIMELR